MHTQTLSTSQKKRKKNLTVFGIMLRIEVVICRIVSHHLLHLRVWSMCMIGQILFRRGCARVRHRCGGCLIDHILSCCRWKIRRGWIRPIPVRGGRSIFVIRSIDMLAIRRISNGRMMRIWFSISVRWIVHSRRCHGVEKVEIRYAHGWRWWMRVRGEMITWFTGFNWLDFGSWIFTGVFLERKNEEWKRRSTVLFWVIRIRRIPNPFPVALENDWLSFREVSYQGDYLD